jgi:hypothetical protein
MRYLSRTAAALAVGGCVLALGASPALATHEFTATHAGALRAYGEGEQVFKLGPFRISCEQAKGKGHIPSASGAQTMFASIRYKRCVTAAKIGTEPITLKTLFRTPVDIEYHANGYVEIGSESEEVEGQAVLKGGEVEITVPSVKCLVSWPEQTIPGKAVKKPEEEYSQAIFTTFGEPANLKRFPTGERELLKIENKFGKLTYEYSGGQCEEFKKPEEELHNGKVKGVLNFEQRKGDLEFH